MFLHMKLEKLCSRVRRALFQYDMIAPGDKIAVGLSGGKDSIALLYALSNIRSYYPHPFELVAITVDLGFPEGFDTEPLSDLCKKLDVPYHVVHTEISKAAFHDPDKISPCYLCAKLRKGALNDYAKSLGCNTIAYGHHKDDAIETFFLSLLFEGQLNCFSPVTHLSISGLKLIRPMIYLNESEVIGFSNKYELPIVKNPCPSNGNSKRAFVREYIEQLHKENPEFKKRIFHSICDGHFPEWVPVNEKNHNPNTNNGIISKE